MNRSLLRITAYLQIGLTILLATGCSPTQPFFYNESPDLQYYLNTATRIEYPDVEVESLAETTESEPPSDDGQSRLPVLGPDGRRVRFDRAAECQVFRHDQRKR